MFTYEVRFTRLLTEKLDREREGGGRPLSQSLFPRRYHNFWCAVGVASCRACLAFHAPRRAAAPLTLSSRRRFGLTVCRSGLSRFGYLGQIPSVAYRGARSPPSSLTPSCNLSHSLPRNTQPAAASCTTVENRPLQCGTSNATMTIHFSYSIEMLFVHINKYRDRPILEAQVL